ILEKMHPATIPGYQAPATPASRQDNPPPAAGPMGPAASIGSMNREDLGAPREFIVRRPGMTIHDIAREELRDPNQWQRIFLLTRQVNPREELPVGARIYLPRSGGQ